MTRNANSYLVRAYERASEAEVLAAQKEESRRLQEALLHPPSHDLGFLKPEYLKTTPPTVPIKRRGRRKEHDESVQSQQAMDESAT